MYSDKLEIHILELPKIQYASEISEEYSETALYDWCKFFSIESKEELDAMYGKNEYIDKACDHIVELSADEKKKLEYDIRFKALSDYNTQMSSSYNRGVKAGIEQGIQQGTLNKVKIKLAKGKTADLIADELEESLEYINECIRKIEDNTI